MSSLPDNTDTAMPVGWRWAPAWVLAFVALWPAPGYAEAVMVLGALAAIARLLLARFRDGSRLLSGPAWALTSVLFCSYWLPELVSAFDAVDHGRAFRESLVDLRYLPFLWLVAAAVGNARGRRITFGGLGIITALWTVDALVQAVAGTSPLFAGMPAAPVFLESHQDAVLTIPLNATLLGGNAHTPVQALAYGPGQFSVQFHPEFTPEILRLLWTERRAALRGTLPFDADAVLDAAASTPWAPGLFARFLDLIPSA